MSCKTTRKNIAESCYCAEAGYCELQNLFRHKSPMYYTSGTYGWNFDAYVFNMHGVRVAITTGYRGTISNGKNNLTHELAREYEAKAREIIAKSTYDEEAEKLDILIEEFLDAVFPQFAKATKA